MSGWQKNLKKDFSLGQYYSQLEKYESASSASKYKPLKKDSSSSSFVKDASKTSNSSKVYKESINIDRPRLGISDKYAAKSSFEKYEGSKQEGKFDLFKKSRPTQEKKTGYIVGESLANSNVSSKKWLVESQTEEKENVMFTTKEERIFVDHCAQLYEMGTPSPTVDQISKQISKRDEVYQAVAQQFPELPSQKYSQQLELYFREHSLMQSIIEQFKSMSKLQISDLSELYYFLKSDRP